jgi:hypothetical protein
LKKLYATSYFGELALINEEPRSASITVASDTAKCLKMTKSKFDEITFLTKMFNVNRRSELSEEMTEKITLLKSLSVANRTKLLESMSKMTFSPGAYICRQVHLIFDLAYVSYFNNFLWSKLSFVFSHSKCRSCH